MKKNCFLLKAKKINNNDDRFLVDYTTDVSLKRNLNIIYDWDYYLFLQKNGNKIKQLEFNLLIKD